MEYALLIYVPPAWDELSEEERAGLYEEYEARINAQLRRRE